MTEEQYLKEAQVLADAFSQITGTESIYGVLDKMTTGNLRCIYNIANEILQERGWEK